MQRRQLRIRSATLECLEPFRRWFAGGLQADWPKLKRCSSEEILIIGDVGFTQRSVGFVRSLVYFLQRQRDRVFGLASRETLVVSRRRNEQNHLVRSLQFERISPNSHFTATIQDSHPRGIPNSFAVHTVVELARHEQTFFPRRNRVESLWPIQFRDERNLPGMVRAQPQHHDLIRRAYEHLACELNVPPPELHPRDRIVEV